MNAFPVVTAALSVILFGALSLWKYIDQQDKPKKTIRTGPIHTTDAMPRELQEQKKPQQQQQQGDFDPPSARPEEWMAIIVTLGIGASALYIILSKQYEQDALKWAYGALGTVVGYWLKR